VTRAGVRASPTAGFIEAERPSCSGWHGGANARPSLPTSNAYDRTFTWDFVALELYLKRLGRSGGIGRSTRSGVTQANEGVDATNQPEFTRRETMTYGD